MRQLAAIFILAFILWQCKSSGTSTSLVGAWTMNAPGLTYQLDLHADSTLTESLFGKNGRWKYAAADSPQNLPAQLLFYNEDNAFRTYQVVNQSADQLELAVGDQKIILNRQEGGTPEAADSFTKFTWSFNAAAMVLPLPPPTQSVRAVVKDVFPEHDGLFPSEVLIRSDTLFVGIMASEVEAWYAAVVFDVPNKKRLAFEQLFRSEGCGASYTLTAQNGKPIIVQRSQCEESDEETDFFAVEKSGAIVKTEKVDLAGSGDPAELLRSLMKSTMALISHQENSVEGRLVFFGTNSDGDEVSSGGSFRMKDDLLIITIDHQEGMGGNTQTGIYKRIDGRWQSLVGADMVSGKVDTLVDLNGDGKQELILKSRKWNSAGANTEYSLWAHLTSGRFEKVKPFATNSEGYSIFNFDANNKQVVSEIKYVQSTDTILIQVTENRQWTVNAEKQETGSEKEVISYAWDGKQLSVKN